MFYVAGPTLSEVEGAPARVLAVALPFGGMQKWLCFNCRRQINF
jgi:hypothetical protein